MDELCAEKHKQVDAKFDIHERRINKHSEEIDDIRQEIGELKADNREFKTQIQNLCKQISELTTTLRWFIGLLVGAFTSFFFYAIQKGIFK